MEKFLIKTNSEIESAIQFFGESNRNAIILAVDDDCPCMLIAHFVVDDIYTFTTVTPDEFVI